jgi:signal transduction histidine kinase
MDERPFAVLIHDAAVLEDPALQKAVSTATRLTASNAELQAEVRAQLDELTASRRRLVVAADDERARLEARLERGAEQRLLRILSGLRRPTPSGSDEHLTKAIAHLQRTVEEVRDLARGLHPRELAEGLLPALSALAEATAVPVQLRVTDERFPTEVEAAAYFTCAEALANVMKHAAASSGSIAVSSRNGQLIVIVADDGVGGADLAGGSGLVGMRDRIEALGGRLALESTRGRGTSLTATIPFSDEPS